MWSVEVCGVLCDECEELRSSVVHHVKNGVLRGRWEGGGREEQ